MQKEVLFTLNITEIYFLTTPILTISAIS